MTKPAKLGATLRRARLDAKMTLTKLGKRVKVSASYICRIERGEKMRQPSPSILTAIAKVLKLNPDEVFRIAGRIPTDIERFLLTVPGAIELTRAMMPSPSRGAVVTHGDPDALTIPAPAETKPDSPQGFDPAFEDAGPSTLVGHGG